MTTPTHSPEPWQTAVCPYCDSIVAASRFIETPATKIAEIGGKTYELHTAIAAELTRLREQNRQLTKAGAAALKLLDHMTSDYKTIRDNLRAALAEKGE